VVTHQETYADRRFGIGMPDFGGQPLHGKVVLWERELPKTFSGTEKTPCYVPMYRRTSLILWNRRLSPLWRPGLPFGVYYSRTPACSIPVEGVNPTGAYIKLRKNPRNYKRQEKFEWNSDALRLIRQAG